MKKIALFALFLAVVQPTQAAKNEQVSSANQIKITEANCGGCSNGGCTHGDSIDTAISIAQYIASKDEAAQYAKQVSCGGDCKHGNCDSIDMPIIQ